MPCAVQKINPVATRVPALSQASLVEEFPQPLRVSDPPPAGPAPGVDENPILEQKPLSSDTKEASCKDVRWPMLGPCEADYTGTKHVHHGHGSKHGMETNILTPQAFIADSSFDMFCCC